jgi:putative zinc-dependent peptidase DUF5700
MRRLLFVVALLFLSWFASAQDVDVDISACRGMYDVLKAMHAGKPREEVAKRIDALLETRAYRMMFRHYNRSWRPNHLPKDVFRRMILSLRYEGQYAAGENERADAMRVRWKRFYDDLPLYERKLRQLEGADLKKLVREGVRYAQGWLPPEWKIPPSYLAVVPNGGSPAFTIEDTQGYDFLQIPDDVQWLVGTISHESHHLGMRTAEPKGLTKRESLAFRVLTLTMAEGIATKFISGPPAGCVPVLAEVPFDTFSPELKDAWKERVADEEESVGRLLASFDQALAGEVTDEALDRDLREYWLSGTISRAYMVGADLFGAIYVAFGKERLFEVMRDPRLVFRTYNAALDAKPDVLGRCARVPEKAAQQALAIGRTATVN